MRKCVPYRIEAGLFLAPFLFSWEQRKLGDVAGIYDGVHHTPDYKNHGVMFLSVENIMTMRSAKYISEDDFKRDYRIYPQKGDILMTLREVKIEPVEESPGDVKVFEFVLMCHVLCLSFRFGGIAAVCRGLVNCLCCHVWTP